MNRGALYALLAYIFWGLHPVYWKLLKHVPAAQIVSNRIIFSLLFFAIINMCRGSWQDLFTKVKTYPNKWILFTPGLLIGSNWAIYIWGVTSGYVVEVSLGYFISPLVIVFLGVFFLHESLRKYQWWAITIAGIGMLYLAVIYGQIPWISLLLAGTWGFYSLLRKKSPLTSVEGLTLETMLLSLPAIAYLIYVNSTGQSMFLVDIKTPIMLIGTGIVSGLPLLVFIAGARMTSMATLGILQYIYPTIIFILGVYGFHEPLVKTKLIGFIFIWLALIIYTIENTLYYRKKLQSDS